MDRRLGVGIERWSLSKGCTALSHGEQSGRVCVGRLRRRRSGGQCALSARLVADVRAAGHDPGVIAGGPAGGRHDAPDWQGGAPSRGRLRPERVCWGPWGQHAACCYCGPIRLVVGMIDAAGRTMPSRIERAPGLCSATTPRPAAILLTPFHPTTLARLSLARTWACEVYMNPAELPVALHPTSQQWWRPPVLRPVGRAAGVCAPWGRRASRAVLARSSLREVARTFEPDPGVPACLAGSAFPRQAHSGHVSYFRPVTAS